MKAPKNLGAPAATPSQTATAPPAGPTQDGSGKFAIRTPAPGPLTLENNGTGKQGDWLLIDSAGVKQNPPITTAPAMAYFIKQRGYADRVENLELLGRRAAQHGGTTPGYSLADVARGLHQ